MVVHSTAMTNPFDSAWALLKGIQSQLNTPSLDGANHNALAERAWRKRKDANEPIRVPAQPEHVQEMVALGNASPEHFHDEIEDDIKAEQRHRKLLDNKDRFKQVLNNYIPRLEKRPHFSEQSTMPSANDYYVKVGPRSVGRVNTTGAERDDPQNNWTSLDSGAINDFAQRQGLYGRALQGVINDAGSLTSYSRNRMSQPFHEQFNPPNATKEITQAGDVEDKLEDHDTHEYTAKPPQETPRGFNDLQYDTGAMPVFDSRREAEDPIYHFDGLTQQTLNEYGVPYDRQ